MPRLMGTAIALLAALGGVCLWVLLTAIGPQLGRDSLVIPGVVCAVMLGLAYVER